MLEFLGWLAIAIVTIAAVLVSVLAIGFVTLIIVVCVSALKETRDL